MSIHLSFFKVFVISREKYCGNCQIVISCNMYISIFKFEKKINYSTKCNLIKKNSVSIECQILEEIRADIIITPHLGRRVVKNITSKDKFVMRMIKTSFRKA